MAFQKGNKYGNRFTSENQPSTSGRKPKLYTIAKKGYNLSHADFIEVVRYIFQCTKGEIEKIEKAEDTPIWVSNICRAIYKDTGKGNLYAFKELTDRLYGTAKNTTSVDLTTNGKDMSAPQLVFSPTPLTEADIQEIQDIRDGRKTSDSDNTSVPEVE